jgi:hypothetical protein
MTGARQGKWEMGRHGMTHYDDRVQRTCFHAVQWQDDVDVLYCCELMVTKRKVTVIMLFYHYGMINNNKGKGCYLLEGIFVVADWQEWIQNSATSSTFSSDYSYLTLPYSMISKTTSSSSSSYSNNHLILSFSSLPQ